MNKTIDTKQSEEASGKGYIGRFIFTVVLATLIGTAYFSWDIIVSHFTGSLKTEKSAKADKAPAKEKKIKYWRAPMDPSYTSDKPGKSPMGMDLVPVYEDEDSDSGFVKINPAVVQNIGVRSAVARRQEMSKTIRTVGLVTYDETKLAKIESKVKGWVEKLYVNETGQEISKDTILLELFSPDLVTTQEEYILALKYRDSLKDGARHSIAESGESLLASARRRLELFDVPEHQIRELERTRNVKKTLHIHSTVDGVIIRKDLVEGMFVKPGQTLYEIADLRKVWVNVDIYEYEIPYVKVGQKVEMTLASFPGRMFNGKITYIYPFMDSKSRSVKVRLEFDNENMELKPDMYGDVVIQAGKRAEVIAIPTEAIIRTGSRALIFIDLGEGRFEPREAAIGLESEGMTEIIKGVKEGERVVTSAQFLIDSESKLREAVSKMSSPKDEQPMESKPEMDSGSMDHSGTDHSQTGDGSMDHSGMDHSQMGDGSMDHSGTDHSQMGDSSMDHSGMDHSQTGDGSMDHSGMDHSQMGDGSMDHSGH